MRRLRRIKGVHMVVSDNFYKLLENERDKFERTDFGKTLGVKGRGGNNKISLAAFTEMIHKNITFKKPRRFLL